MYFKCTLCSKNVLLKSEHGHFCIIILSMYAFGSHAVRCFTQFKCTIFLHKYKCYKSMQQKKIFYNKKQNKNTGHSAQLHVVFPSVRLFHLAILFMLSVL